jgi:uncharacterized protein YlxW (UPF0749 family)
MSQEEEVSTTEQEASLDGGTILSQYNYMIDESPSYQEYKNIKKPWVAKFGKNLSDSIAFQQSEKKKIESQIKAKDLEIKDLSSKLVLTKDSLTGARIKTNSMAWVGMPMQKSSYRMLMWGIIFTLSISVIVFIILYKNTQAVTKQTKALNADLEEEFTQYKRRSLEREQKLRRELQDEINKQKGK